MIEYYEVAKKIRQHVRMADRFGRDRKSILEELIALAENYEAVAERTELQMIAQMQNDARDMKAAWAQAAEVSYGNLMAIEKHCDCGCIYLEAECPNCNYQSPQDRIKELEDKLAKAISLLEIRGKKVSAISAAVKEGGVR